MPEQSSAKQPYELSVVGLELQCSPPLPFDLATYADVVRKEEGSLSFQAIRPSLLKEAREKKSENEQQILSAFDAHLLEMGLPLRPSPVCAGLVSIAEAELRARGLPVIVENALRGQNDETFASASESQLCRFVACRNCGVIRYPDRQRPELLQEMAGTFPNARIAILTTSDFGAESIASNSPGFFQVRMQESFTDDEIASRVIVGTYNSLQQREFGFRHRDLIIIADAKMCDHVACEVMFLLQGTYARLFVAIPKSETLHPKVQDRIVQYVGLDSLAIGPNNTSKTSIWVKYHRIMSSQQKMDQEADEVKLLTRLEAHPARNTELAKVAEQESVDNAEGVTVLVAASASHAERLAAELPDWVYCASDLRDASKIPAEIAPRTKQVSSLPDQNVGKVVCTSSSLKLLNSRSQRIVIVWAGLRAEPLELPTRLQFSEPNLDRTLTIVDIQDSVHRRDQWSSAQIRILSGWNKSRRQTYASREWIPVGTSSGAFRMAAARKRLVIVLKETPTIPSGDNLE